jgi:hypothetical protein
MRSWASIAASTSSAENASASARTERDTASSRAGSGRRGAPLRTAPPVETTLSMAASTMSSASIPGRASVTECPIHSSTLPTFTVTSATWRSTGVPAVRRRGLRLRHRPQARPHKRGELMSQAPKGAMAAIDIANINSRKQCILSCEHDEIHAPELRAVYTEAGAGFIPLKVSAAFHSRCMTGVQQEFALHLAGFDLVDQISGSARWYESMCWRRHPPRRPPAGPGRRRRGHGPAARAARPPRRPPRHDQAGLPLLDRGRPPPRPRGSPSTPRCSPLVWGHRRAGTSTSGT